MRFTTVVVATAALALSPSTAPASTHPPARVDAANHAGTMRSLARLHHQLDVQAARIAAPARTAPPATTRIVHSDEGFSWVDGAIGAGATAALLLAAGAVVASRPSPRASRDQPARRTAW
jgi:hypothetical protein